MELLKHWNDCSVPRQNYLYIAIFARQGFQPPVSGNFLNMSELKAEVNRMSQHLAAHPIYQHLNSLAAIKCFMEYHVFAVFDFMSLLKSLQNQITCTSLPS